MLKNGIYFASSKRKVSQGLYHIFARRFFLQIGFKNRNSNRGPNAISQLADTVQIYSTCCFNAICLLRSETHGGRHSWHRNWFFQIAYGFPKTPLRFEERGSIRRIVLLQVDFFLAAETRFAC